MIHAINGYLIGSQCHKPTSKLIAEHGEQLKAHNSHPTRCARYDNEREPDGQVEIDVLVRERSGSTGLSDRVQQARVQGYDNNQEEYIDAEEDKSRILPAQGEQLFDVQRETCATINAIKFGRRAIINRGHYRDDCAQ